MDKAKRQEIFDRVAKHLLSQNARSKGPTYSSFCLYRGPNGLKCAVGALISDEYYEEAINSLGTSSPLVVKALEKSLGVVLELDDYYLLNALQRVHDQFEIQDWRAGLNNVATRFGLTNARD